MQFNGYWEEDRWNESKHIYTFETGTIIEFISFDKFGKAHGPRRDILFLNEANNIPYGIADQLITRTRKIVWMDWNPSEEFWAYTELIPSRKDLDFITLTYLDNEGLDNISRQEIESHRHNKQWWTVYGEGRLGEITSRIYTNWAKLDEIPHEARLERRWLDFGYTNDPSAIGDIYYYNGGWILDEQLYQKGMSNKQIADFLNSLSSKNTLVIADSAEPKSIDEIRSYGLNVIPSQKGPDSVRAGIQLVQDQPISVTRRSVNVWKEYNNYLFLVDKNDKILNEEDPKCANHHMSGIRYALSTLGRLKQEVSYWDRIFDDKKINKNIINRGK
jgi:phage terminase large subunit